MKRTKPVAVQEPLSLNLETAPAEPAPTRGRRFYVGGFLGIEGVMVLLIGMTLMLSYWPPVAGEVVPANPVSRLGMWVCFAAMLYMVVVTIVMLAFNRRAPRASAREELAGAPPIVIRARRYASMKRRTRYIFDDDIRCEEEAEEAIHARQLY